ncbi:MAG: PASTA domain-containing protein, partial [Gemmatimonadetes bacterium]|nr:PASTA domain-containing protein [Gemmatimonadota bacterium]
QARNWAIGVLAAGLAGYLTAYLVVFPAPILPGYSAVPRVLGLTVQEAHGQLTRARMRAQNGGTEPHPTAPSGAVIWQDPPPGVIAPEGAKVTLVASGGPPKIPVPDVAGYEGGLAQRLISAAGLAVSKVESLPGSVPRGITMIARPPAGTLLAPGSGVILVVSQGAATIAVPDLLAMSLADARARLELEGLQIGTVTRRRTADANPGTVVAQKPAAGTLAAPGTVVDLIIARSPQ